MYVKVNFPVFVEVNTNSKEEAEGLAIKEAERLFDVSSISPEVESVTVEGEKEYIGSSCPCCGSENIEGEDFDFEGNSREVSCTDCNARWNELFTLTGFELIEGGDEGEDDEDE